MLDEILGDKALPAAAVRIGPSAINRDAHKAWALWRDVTSRPNRREPPDRRFIGAAEDALRVRSFEQVSRIVRGAAALPVNPNDPHDTRRAIRALTQPKTMKLAIQAWSAGLPVIPFPTDDKPLLSSITDVEAACRIRAGEWSERDQEAAVTLMETLTPQALEEAATQAALAVGLDAVYPVEVLRAARSRKAPSRKAGTKTVSRSAYQAGVTQRAKVEGVEFSLDDLAHEMQLRGIAAERIAHVHHSAPEGYWDAVFALVCDGDSNEAAYRRLTDRFGGWHPDMRRPESGLDG